MSRYLAMSFRFLSPWFHGRGDEGTPEWPPSPLRVFQSVVAAAARAGTLESTRAALRWLEERSAPLIVAPDVIDCTIGYRLSVPHNAMDLVAKQWSRGDEGNPAGLRAMKNVRPSHLPDDTVVHYLWELDDGPSATQPLIAAARYVIALGWGVDLVVADGRVVEGSQLADLSAAANLWMPRADGRSELRTPVKGTLDDLEKRHAAFHSRIAIDVATLRPPAALSSFAITRYARAEQPTATDVAAFALMRIDSDNFRAFDTARRGMAVAGMLRHTVRRAAERAGWDDARVLGSVLGHGENYGRRLALVPVPSIEPRGNGGETAGAIRRVMVFSTDARGTDTHWASRVLGGLDLIDEHSGEVQAVLALVPQRDRVLDRYVGESKTWVTVTPLILPGHDEREGTLKKLRNAPNSEKQRSLIERLLVRRETLVRKALRHAGFHNDLVFSAQIETRETGFLAGVEKASRYAVPSHLANAPRLHVKLTWPVNVAGPICIGRGRFSGLGLFATVKV